MDVHVPEEATPQRLAHAVPPIPPDAHKGVRGRVLIIGGSAGMAGAVHFAASGALRSGAGLVRAVVAPASVMPLQANTPSMVTHAWGAQGHIDSDAVREFAPHALVIGPGLGRDQESLRAFTSVLQAVHAATKGAARDAGSAGASSWTPRALVLDADALQLMVHAEVRALLWDIAPTCAVVLTPHMGEFRALLHGAGFAKLLSLVEQRGQEAEVQLFAARELAASLSCTVVLKGPPTWCVALQGADWVASHRTPALATGGTGDVLSGIIGALCAAQGATSQGEAWRVSAVGASLPVAVEDVAAAAVWVHGRAGAVAAQHTSDALPDTTVRGFTVEDVVAALPSAWRSWDLAVAALPSLRSFVS